MECGANYLHISHFCTQSYACDSLKHPGLIMHAFIDALIQYFHRYVHCVLKISMTSRLMQIKYVMGRLMRQVKCIAELCMLTSDPKTFPKGISLLSYLYQETLEMRSSPYYGLMLSLLKSAAAPYLRYVHLWVFNGSCADPFGEFLIQSNTDYLNYRDHHYWTSGFTLQNKPTIQLNFTLFLSELSEDIFVCGKTLNLLRLCTSNKHFLFGTVGYNGIEAPPVTITTSSEELDSLTLSCDIYIGHMTEIARQVSTNRREQQRRNERAKRQLRVQAHQTATRKLRQIEERLLQQRIENDAKKRQHFNELKDQMEIDLQRRANEKQQEKDRDAEISDKYHRQELLEANIQEEQHEKARYDCLIFFFNILK